MEQTDTIEANDTLTSVKADLTVYAFEVPAADEVLFAIGEGRDKVSGKKIPLPPGVTRNGNTLKFKGVAGPIVFAFVDRTPSLKLAFDDTDPIWACAGTDCPTVSGNQPFPVTGCKDGTLSIANSGAPGDYSYTLRFLDKDGKDHSFDPIIKNRA